MLPEVDTPEEVDRVKCVESISTMLDR